MTAPVAVGGQGGSGTRVVAAMLQELGYYLGADLNRALDNLWYTILLKRRDLDSDAEVVALDTFLRAMQGELPLTPAHLSVLSAAATDVAVNGHSVTGAGRGAWAFRRVVSLLEAQARSSARPRWGWKEPNTHLRLPTLCARIPDLRYVHVVRHGLNMAFSSNQAQVHWWGPSLGIEPPSDAYDLPATSLHYWAVTTRRAEEIGERALGERFLLLRFEDACDRPERTARRLSAFLDEDVDEVMVKRLAGLPAVPASIDRHHDADLARFDPEDLAVLERYGYAVDGA